MRIFWILVCLVGVSLPAFAHTPHHVIDELELSPDYENDSTLFILVHNYLLRSTERGANWQQLVNGIDSPYVLTDIALSESFAVDNTLFVTTAGDGVFKSADRGQSWNRFNAGLRQLNIGKSLVVPGEGGQSILAAGSSRGLFASATEDADWHRVLSDDVQITALAVVEDNASLFVVAGDSNGGIWKSGEYLKNWQRIARVADAGAITSVASNPLREPTDTILVGTEKSGLLRLSASGAMVEHLSVSWPDRLEDCRNREVPTAVLDAHIRDIKLSDDSLGIFVTTWNRAVHVSHDAGESWETLSSGLHCDDQADAAAFVVPHFRDLEMGGAGQHDWFLASFDGLYRSEDTGESWQQFETMPVSLIRGLGISPASGDKHNLLVTTYGGGAYLVADHGQSWTVLNHGLVSTRLADAEFSPEYWTDGLVFGLAKERLLRTDKKDNSWHVEPLAYSGWRRRVGFGLERRLGFSPKYGSELFLDDSERGGVWPMQLELSPLFAEDQTMLVGLRGHGVWISNDAGASWNRNWEGPTDYVTDLTISPEFSKDGTAFAAIRGAGIYVTRDGSSSWHPANSGFEYFEEFQATKSPNHVIDPPLTRAITDVVLAISPQYGQDSTVFAGSAAGIFRSSDGGRTWGKLALATSSKSASVIGVGVSPNYGSDQMVFVSVKGSGLYRSTNGGQSFEPAAQDLLKDNAELKHIGFSPSFRTDKIVYGASEWDLYISRDSGDTWTVVGRPIRYEDRRGSYPGPVWFTGEWVPETGPGFSASTQTTSETPGAKARLNFDGTSLSWSGERGPSAGMARIVIDGVDVASVDLYSEQESSAVRIFQVSDLQDKPHNVVIEVLDRKNPESSGRRVTVDSIDVLRH